MTDATLTSDTQVSSEEKRCKCDDGSWLIPIPDICDKFERDDYDMCKNCDHDEACHEQT